MNSDAKLLKSCIKEYVASAPDKVKRQKEKVFRKGILADFTNEITKDWYIADLFDVTHLVTCGVAKRPEYVEEGIPFLSAQNARPFKANLNKIRYIDKETFEKITVGGKPEKDDVLYTRVGNCGEAAKITFDFDFGVYVSLTLIKPVHELLDSDYLVAFLNSRFGLMQAGQGAIGIGLKNLNVDNVRRYIIPLPPLAEQKKIAAKLDELLRQVNTIKTRLDTIPTILKRFRQSVLAAAVSGKLTDEWRKKLNGTEPQLKNIGEYIELIYGKSLPAKKRTGNGFPVYGSNGEVGRHEDYTVEGPFIVIGRKGSNGVVTWSEESGWPIDTTYYVKINKEKIELKFSYYMLQTLGLTELNRSTAIPGLNREDAYACKFLLPDLKEQAEIVSQVEKLFSYATQIEQRVKNAQTRINNLTQSILAKAFRGELTAEWREQNSSLISGENSAESLLERINTQRDKKKSTITKRKVKA